MGRFFLPVIGVCVMLLFVLATYARYNPGAISETGNALALMIGIAFVILITARKLEELRLKRIERLKPIRKLLAPK